MPRHLEFVWGQRADIVFTVADILSREDGVYDDVTVDVDTIADIYVVLFTNLNDPSGTIIWQKSMTANPNNVLLDADALEARGRFLRADYADITPNQMYYWSPGLVIDAGIDGQNEVTYEAQPAFWKQYPREVLWRPHAISDVE